MPDKEKLDHETAHRWFAIARLALATRLHSFEEADFHPYVTAIGRLLLSWNDLHEKLALLYVAVTDTDWPMQPLIVWHSTRSDAGKRLLISATMTEMAPIENKDSDLLRKEISWILEKTQEIEGLRDDAAHTPLDYFAPASPDNPFAMFMLRG